MQQSVERKYPLKAYREQAPNLEVFQFEAKPRFTPIDFNIFALTETAEWSQSDRMRFWYVYGQQEKKPHSASIFDVPPHFVIHKLDREEDAFCHCQITLDGELIILSNSSSYAQDFFVKVFVNVPPTFYGMDNWETSNQWIREPVQVEMFRGYLDGAMGWTERVPAGIDRSIEEAKLNFHLKKWNPCVVMCRRALEEIMQFAFRRFFKQEPKGLDFNAIVRKFEKEKPDVIPKHWIGILDSVRNLGNVPGAHPSIRRYKFTRVDAEVALLQTNAFRQAYFAKIDKD